MYNIIIDYWNIHQHILSPQHLQKLKSVFTVLISNNLPYGFLLYISLSSRLKYLLIGVAFLQIYRNTWLEYLVEITFLNKTVAEYCSLVKFFQEKHHQLQRCKVRNSAFGFKTLRQHFKNY